jgi:class 3 adenylate cyclase
VLGIISIDTTKAGKKFKDGDLKLLTAIASPIATAIKNAQLVKEKEKEVAARTSLQRYFSPALVDKIVGGQLSLDGERREGIAFFSDIVGFTAMSNRLKPEDVVSLINSYFEKMVEILFRHNATIDKFSGDAIMAVWGAPEGVEHGPWHSVQAAMEMQNALYEFNCGQISAGRETIEMGIGLNYGKFVAGNMGASAHNMVNYTIIGEDVNLAARVQAKAGPSQVMISASVYDLIKDRVCAVSLPPTKVKGIPDPITIYSIRGVCPIEDRDSGRLIVCLPVQLSANGHESRRSFLVGCEKSADGSPLFALLSQIELQQGQTVKCTFDMKEMPNLGSVTGTIVDVLPYEKTPAIPQLARVRIDSVPDSFKDLLTVGKASATSVTWEQMGRGS